MNDEPAFMSGASPRARASRARAFAESVQSQCLSSVSSAGRALLGLRRGTPEPVEQLHVRLHVAPYLVVLRQVLDELPHTRAQLVREVRRRRADQGVDVVPSWLAHGLAHGPNPNG